MKTVGANVPSKDSDTRAHAEVKLSEINSQSIIEASPWGMHLYELTDDGRLIFSGANPSADRILGIRHADLVGPTIEEAFSGHAGDDIAAICRKVALTGESWNSEQVNYDDNKVSGAFEVYAFQTSPGHMVASFLDITERKTVEEEARRLLGLVQQEKDRLSSLINSMSEMERDLARSNTELQSFAYAASHDLREPLRTISGFLELLEMDYGDRLDDTAKGYIVRAVDASSRLHEMIDDILSFARLETRKKPFARVDLNAIAGRVLHELDKRIKDKGATVFVDPLPTVWGDDTQIVIVFRNLIDNAIKFHGKERPVIQIYACRTDEDWTVSVKDNGIGIDPGDYGRVFNMFVRLHSRKDYPGTGIGLAMCRKIIERHGGRIWAESQVGVGSTFTFTLPDQELRCLVSSDPDPD